MPNKYTASSSTVHNRYLGSGGFKGVDFTSSPAFVSPDRFSDAKNVYKDYRNGIGACVETFPGYRIPLSFDVYESEIGNSIPVEIHGMVVWHVNGSATAQGNTVSNEDVVAIHAGNRLYIVPLKSIKGKPFSNRFIPSITFPTAQNTNSQGWYTIESGDGTYSTFYCTAFGEDEPATDFKSFVAHYNFLPDTPCKMFAENGDLYILGENGYFKVRLQSGSFETGIETLRSHYLFKAEPIVKKVKDEYRPGVFRTFWGSSYTPLTYINNEPYEQANMLNDSFAEEFTRLEIKESEEEIDDLKVVTLKCSCFPSSKIYFMYGFPDGAGTPTFAGSSIRIEVGGYTVFDGGDPVLDETRDDVSVEFYYRGLIVDEYLAAELGDKEKWRMPFDEIRFSQAYAINKETGDFTDSEFKKILGADKTVRISVDGQTDVPSAILDEFDGSPAEAILGCKEVSHHDGRIFFAGNPRFPNVVFYTQRDLNGKNDPTYVGAQNYFRVGGEGTPIKSMVSTSSSLVIFKETGASGEESSVFYATGVTTEADIIPRVYSVTQGAVGVGCSSRAVNFADDICFASKSGIYGLNKLQTNLERSVASRSKLIDGRFVSEDTDVLMCEWEGYLCVYCKSGHMYLADSRQLSSDGYEWFYVDGIGYHWGTVGRAYADPTLVGKTVYDLAGNEVGTSVFGSIGGQIKSGYFHHAITNENGEEELLKIPCRYSERIGSSGSEITVITSDGEKFLASNSVFYPATTMAAVGDSIWLGANGHLLILNSDMRGVPNGEGDAGVDPMRIRSKWYTHNGIRYESYVMTYYDDAGTPNLSKSTINRSTVIDMKTIPGSAFKVSVYTERDGWRLPAQSTAAIPDYGESDFGSVSFSGGTHTVVTLREHTNRWSRKMYRIYSDEFCRPFGIHRISYQFKVAGRIKD